MDNPFIIDPTVGVTRYISSCNDQRYNLSAVRSTVTSPAVTANVTTCPQCELLRAEVVALKIIPPTGVEFQIDRRFTTMPTDTNDLKQSVIRMHNSAVSDTTTLINELRAQAAELNKLADGLQAGISQVTPPAQ